MRSALPAPLYAALAALMFTGVAAPSSAQADNQLLTRAQDAVIHPVGRWPEGVAGHQSSIWVAESGARTVSQIDAATGKVRKTIKVGRLPVSIAIAGDGAPIVQVNTDKALTRIDPETLKARRLARLPDGPEETVIAGDFAYTLLWQGDSSGGSSVLRTHLKTGKAQRSKDTGNNAFGLAVGGGVVWISRGAGQLTMVDVKTLAIRGTVTLGTGSHHVAHTGAAAVATVDASVVLLNAEGAISHRAALSASVTALAAWDDLVAAACKDGSIWLLDPKTLAPRAHLTAAKPYTARAITRLNGSLWLTRHESATGDDRGSLIQVALPTGR